MFLFLNYGMGFSGSHAKFVGKYLSVMGNYLSLVIAHL